MHNTGTMYTVLVIIGVSTYSCTITIAEVIRCTVKLFQYSQLYEFDGIIASCFFFMYCEGNVKLVDVVHA